MNPLFFYDWWIYCCTSCTQNPTMQVNLIQIFVFLSLNNTLDVLFGVTILYIGNYIWKLMILFVIAFICWIIKWVFEAWSLTKFKLSFLHFFFYLTDIHLLVLHKSLFHLYLWVLSKLLFAVPSFTSTFFSLLLHINSLINYRI